MKSFAQHAAVAIALGLLLAALYYFAESMWHLHSHTTDLERILAQAPK